MKGTSTKYQGTLEMTEKAEKFWFELIWLDEVSGVREIGLKPLDVEMLLISGTVYNSYCGRRQRVTVLSGCLETRDYKQDRDYC